MPGQDLHHLLMLHMLALEDRGEYEQRLELPGAVEHAGGHRARRVIAPLIRRDHHAAAIKPAVHRRGKPDTAEGARLPVHRDRRAHGMIVEQQALDRDGRVVDGLIRRPAQAVADLAAVAVDAVADAVEEPPRLPVDRHGRQVFQIWPQRKRRGVSRLVQIVQEVVAASGRVIENVIFKHVIICLVQEAVDRAVAAGQHQHVLRCERPEQRRIAVQLRQVVIAARAVRQQGLEPFRALLALAVSCQRIEQDVISHGKPSFCLGILLPLYSFFGYSARLKFNRASKSAGIKNFLAFFVAAWYNSSKSPIRTRQRTHSCIG